MTQILEQLFEPDEDTDEVSGDVINEMITSCMPLSVKQLLPDAQSSTALQIASIVNNRTQQTKLNILGINMQTGSLEQRFKSMERVLQFASAQCPIAAKELNKIKACTPARRCNSPYHNDCANPKCRQGNRYNKPDEQLIHGHCNFRGTKLGKYSSNFQVRNGQRMLEPFDGLPLCFLFAATVNLGCIPLDGDLTEISKQYKKRLRKCIASLSSGAIVRGYLDIKLMYLDQTEFDIPDNAEEPPYHTADRHERIAMAHAHFIVFDPQKSREGVRDVFVDQFPGKKRVCIRHSWEDIECADGSVVKGLAGFAEYSSLQKVELRFGKDNPQAFLEFITINKTWDGRSKFIRYGHRTTDTMSLLDQSIYSKYLLELEEKSKARSWDNNKIGYARKFMYLWFNHVDEFRKLCPSRLNKNKTKHKSRSNGLYIRDLFRILCCLKYKDLSKLSQIVSEHFGCVFYLSCLLANTKRHVHTEKKHEQTLSIYSNWSHQEIFKTPTLYRFLDRKYSYIHEKHHQLVPP